MDLSKYPRPAKDTGWGMHDTASIWHGPQDVAAYARFLASLGIRWFKVLAPGTGKTHFCKALREAGIEPVVRLYAGRPHPRYLVNAGDVRAHVQAGARYFEWGNEPNLMCEWDEASWREGAQPDKTCEQWLANQAVIRAEGGIPLFVALSPGGHYPHRQFLKTQFEWLKLKKKLSTLEGAAIAIHNRPLNHPLDYRDDSGCHFLDYEWIDDLVTAYLGRSLPLLGTEAGYEPGWRQDTTFPAIDLARHAAYNMEILAGFREGRWRDVLFCQCMWLVSPFGDPGHGFDNAHWWGNRAYGRDLPAVEALIADWQARPFVRRFAWETPPAPPPAPQPTPPPADPTPATDPAIIRRRFTPETFAAYVQGLKVKEPYSKVCIHHTWKPTLDRWMEFGGEYWIGNATKMGALERTYRSYDPPWTRFPHVFCAPDGIWVLGALELDGAGVTGGNKGLRHIEIVGDYITALPEGATLDNAVAAAAILLQAAGVGIENLTYHRLMQMAVMCPGDKLVNHWGWFRAQVAARLRPEALPRDEKATDAPTLADKVRWWTEEAARAHQGGNDARAWAILYDIIDHNAGLMYRLERVLKAG